MTYDNGEFIPNLSFSGKKGGFSFDLDKPIFNRLRIVLKHHAYNYKNYR